uniref:tRNA (uracil-O(2)-)-methyltransferase n=1 Tax=Glossina brevipalpis TaxID=37001 RepID=A0A1A9WTP7_9MUSC
MDTLTEVQFWNACSILIRNYHAVNRKIFACIIQHVEKVFKNIEQFNHDFNQVNVSEAYNDDIHKFLSDHSNGLVKDDGSEGFVIYLKLLHKKQEASIKAIAIINFRDISCTLRFKCNELDDFKVKFEANELILKSLNHLEAKNDTLRWLEYVFKPKFLKWCKNIEHQTVITQTSTFKSSLNLIDPEKYNQLYKSLKLKYSQEILKLWQIAEESTDPLKFIYEDLAIAAYLMTLWRSDLFNEQICFADLGTGNGLLVFILLKEGFKGSGYDIRKRKLWSLYPNEVAENLYEKALESYNFDLHSDVNFLIGNHSDELSPWISVWAATLRYDVNYFLLPCCAFEFSGAKYQRRNSSKSIYNDFCNYVEDISKRCGFLTYKDRLKIPSTKRVAFLGIQHNYTIEEHATKLTEIKKFVKNEQHLHPNTVAGCEVKLRDLKEPVKNCTQIDKNVINNLVAKIFFLLLNKQLQCCYIVSSVWQEGGYLTLRELADNLEKSDLKNIKSECGGLKTLLRNKREIFELLPENVVKIRKPQIRQKSYVTERTRKKRRCFFNDNHPQGCPLPEADCAFLH